MRGPASGRDRVPSLSQQASSIEMGAVAGAVWLVTVGGVTVGVAVLPDFDVVLTI